MLQIPATVHRTGEQVVTERVLYLAYEEALSRDRRTGRISNRDRKDLVDEFQRGIQDRDREELQAAMADAAADDPEPADDLENDQE